MSIQILDMADMITYNGVPLATYGMPALMILVLTMLSFNSEQPSSSKATILENAGTAMLSPPAFMQPALEPTAPPEEEEEESDEEQEQKESEKIKGGRKKRNTRRKRNP